MFFSLILLLLTIGFFLLYLGGFHSFLNSIEKKSKIKITDEKIDNPIKNSTSNLQIQANILFEAGMSKLSDSSKLKIDEIVAEIMMHRTNRRNISIHITGSADSSGNLSRNKILAKERSVVVKIYLENKVKISYLQSNKNIAMKILPIRITKGFTPGERELLRSVDISISYA